MKWRETSNRTCRRPSATQINSFLLFENGKKRLIWFAAGNGGRKRNMKLMKLISMELPRWERWSELCCLVLLVGYGRTAPMAPPKGRQTTTTTHNSLSTKTIHNERNENQSTWAAVHQWSWWMERIGWFEWSGAPSVERGKSILFFNFCGPALRPQKVDWKEMEGFGPPRPAAINSSIKDWWKARFIQSNSSFSSFSFIQN